MIIASAHGVAGELSATFRPQEMGGAEVTARPPLELRGPFFEGDQWPSYYLRNVTSGVFACDSYDVTLRTEHGVDVTVTSPSATKVYAMPECTAKSRVLLEALPVSRLAYLPQPTILQAGSDLCQETALVVHEGGQVIFCDVVTLGRLASGERLAFRRFQSRLRVRRSCDDALLYRECFTLEPDEIRYCIEAAIGGYGVMITIVATGVAESPASLVGLLPAGPECWAGVDALPGGGGFIVRALAPNTTWATRLLDQCASWSGFAAGFAP